MRIRPEEDCRRHHLPSRRRLSRRPGRPWSRRTWHRPDRCRHHPWHRRPWRRRPWHRRRRASWGRLPSVHRRHRLRRRLAWRRYRAWLRRRVSFRRHRAWPRLYRRRPWDRPSYRRRLWRRLRCPWRIYRPCFPSQSLRRPSRPFAGFAPDIRRLCLLFATAGLPGLRLAGFTLAPPFLGSLGWLRPCLRRPSHFDRYATRRAGFRWTSIPGVLGFTPRALALAFLLLP